MAAIKVALFDEKAHRDEVAKKLQGEKIKKILILGTSEKMVNKIASRLQLPSPAKIIKIEDISSQDEIEKAIHTRRIEGKHVIPVPSIEIKRSYPNIFFNAVKIFRQKKGPVGLGVTPSVHEKSVVRPEYSKRTYRCSRSAFWQQTHNVLVELGIVEKGDEFWASHLVWSNLYKVCPQKGGNPDAALMRLQFEDCKELLKWELDHYRPTRVLFMTGGWAERFLQDLWIPDERRPRPVGSSSEVFVSGRIQTKNGPVTCVEASHPQGKPGRWLQDVVSAFRELREPNDPL